MSIAKTVIISCAGTGSRLGLAKTKALITIGNKTLISYQLELFKDVEDLRIVVGFQANDVINEVLKCRKDVIFVYNHNYFETKTGASFYLGAKDCPRICYGI
jgi:choline kinase